MRTILWAALACVPAMTAFAEECLPANGAKVLAEAKARQVVMLEGEMARGFAAEARALGIPMPEPDFVFLDTAGPRLEAEWIEGAAAAIALSCSWSASPETKFGQQIARWAKR